MYLINRMQKVGNTANENEPPSTIISISIFEEIIHSFVDEWFPQRMGVKN